MTDDTVEDILKPALSSFGINFKKVRVELRISRGIIFSKRVKIIDPKYLFLPIGTYVVFLDGVEWVTPKGEKIAFESLHVTFVAKNNKMEILHISVGLQDIQLGTNVDVAEKQERNLVKDAEKGLSKAFGILKFAKELPKRLEEVFFRAKELFFESEDEEKPEKENRE